MTETVEYRPSVTEVFRSRRRERRQDYEKARKALLKLLGETEGTEEPVDVIARVAEQTGVGEPSVQNALFAMDSAGEVRYENGRYHINRDR